MIGALAAAAVAACAQTAPAYDAAASLENVAVSFRLPAGAEAVQLVLRRAAPDSWYEASLRRRGGAVVIRKRSSGAYHDLSAPARALAASARWGRIRAMIVNAADGSVRISVYADDALVASAVDDGSVGGPPIRTAGQLAVRGAGAAPEGLALTSLPGAEFPAAGSAPDSEARAPQRLLTPARADGVNDAAVFGPAAARVTIFDVRGRKVFEAGGPGAPRWNGRDSAGRVVESGVYIARVDKSGGGRCYQSFAVAK